MTVFLTSISFKLKVLNPSKIVLTHPHSCADVLTLRAVRVQKQSVVSSALFPREVLLRLGVESRLRRVGDELAEHPFADVSAEGFDDGRQLSLSGTAFRYKIAHHSACFLPTSVRIHEFCATYVRSEYGKEHGHDGLLHAF